MALLIRYCANIMPTLTHLKKMNTLNVKLKFVKVIVLNVIIVKSFNAITSLQKTTFANIL